MPHVDEFFAATSLAVAGLAVAIAIHPAPVPAANDAAVAATAASPGEAVVRLPAIEVVARRSDAYAPTPRDWASRWLKPAA